MEMQDISLMPKIKATTLRSGTQKLIENLIADKWNLRDIPTPTGKTTANELYHHTYGKDPATLGALPGDVQVYVYYQPANAHERAKKGCVSYEGWRSGRQRLFVRSSSRDGSAIYVASHPSQKIGGTNNNAYANWNLVDPEN